MPLQFEQRLVEVMVAHHLAAGRVPSLQAARFHRERERIYRVGDPDDRNEAFFQLYLDWFREWALDQQFTGLAGEFPLLQSALALLALRCARNKREEGAELYVNDAGQKHGVLSVREERLRQTAGLDAFARHELLHLHDMLDPAFGYAPDIRGPSTPAQQRLARERYRVLWDITIDGRLFARGTQGQAGRLERRAEFDAAFPFWPGDKRDAIFSSLWHDAAPTHAILESHVRDPRDLAHSAGPLPGAPCPLCAFPTFEWASEAELLPGTRASIRAEFPQWTPAQGLCGRCADIYRLVSLANERQAAHQSAA